MSTMAVHMLIAMTCHIGAIPKKEESREVSREPEKRLASQAPWKLLVRYTISALDAIYRTQ